jgi:hypothetical protein
LWAINDVAARIGGRRGGRAGLTQTRATRLGEMVHPRRTTVATVGMQAIRTALAAFAEIQPNRKTFLL